MGVEDRAVLPGTPFEAVLGQELGRLDGIAVLGGIDLPDRLTGLVVDRLAGFDDGRRRVTTAGKAARISARATPAKTSPSGWMKAR